MMKALIALAVIVFPGGFNWPLWVGMEKGFFAQNGVEITVTPTPNSVYQMQNLAAGKFDIAFSTVDNVIAYNEGQGEAPLAETPDFFAFMGGQYGAITSSPVRAMATAAGSIAPTSGNGLYTACLGELPNY